MDYLGDYDVTNAEGQEERSGANDEDVQIVLDGANQAANYRLIPLEDALYVEAVDGTSMTYLRLRLSQVRRFVEELDIHTLYFRSGIVTLRVPLDELLSGNPAKLAHLLYSEYADMAMELIDFSAIDFEALPSTVLSEEELRGYQFEISVAPKEIGFEVNVSLREGDETVGLEMVTQNMQLCMHGEGAQVGYANLFGMIQGLSAAYGEFPAASSEAVEAYETHFDAAAPWADIAYVALPAERVSGMVVDYAGFGNYTLII